MWISNMEYCTLVQTVEDTNKLVREIYNDLWYYTHLCEELKEQFDETNRHFKYGNVKDIVVVNPKGDHFVDTDKGRKCVHDCFYIYKNGREYKVKGVLLGGKDNDSGAVFEAEQDKDDEDIIKLKETYMDKYREKHVNKYVINLKSCSCVKI
ncbi:MAG: hypothetical protein ACLUCA_10795 [Mediterraneibacter gnavus]